MIKNLGWVFGFLAYFLFLKDDFSSNIIPHITPQPQWEISSNHPLSIDHILQQSFFYLSEGGQSYVFASADQKYVLKLFKFQRFRPNLLVKLLPDIFPFKSYRDKHIAKREQKLITAFNGHKLAYDLHKRESGLIFVQLNPSNQSKWITLVDKNQRQKEIDLRQVSYILQEKGEMLSVDLAKILNQGNLLAAKQRLTQVFALYLSEYKKGVYDLDHGVMHNLGCHQTQVFHLDVGKLIKDERIKQPEVYQADLTKIRLKLKNWIDQHYPQYSQELAEYIDRY